MKKNTKTALIIALAVALLTAALITTYMIHKSVITARAVDYLCEKYSEKSDAFEVIDCTVSHYYLNDDAIPQLSKSDNMWEIKYNNRRFFVKQTGSNYVDDYQLEDIEQWAVEYMQNNIDENIVGFDIWSNDLFDYLQTEYPSDKHHLITEDEAEYFLNSNGFNYHLNSKNQSYHGLYVKNYESYPSNASITVGKYDWVVQDADGEMRVKYGDWYRHIDSE